MNKSKFFLVMLTFVLIFSVVACQSATPSGVSQNEESENENQDSDINTEIERGKVVISSGSMGGTWYPFGEAIGAALEKEGYTYSNEPGGGTANIVAVSTGAADIGMTMTTSMTMAAEGDPEFKNITYDNISAALWLMDDPLHVLVSANSGINSFSDLRGKNIGIGTNGQLSQTVAMDLLKLYGLTEKDIKPQYGNPSDHTSLYKDGHIDAWLYIMPIPASNAMDMAISKKSKMIEFTDEDLKNIESIRSGYSTTVIPAGTYQGIDEDVQALNTDVVLIVRDDAPEEWVYDMVKSIVKNREILGDALATMKGITPEQLAKLGNIKIHPGATKYFKEAGLM